MKRLIIALVLLVSLGTAAAQTVPAAKPTFIKGDLNIAYRTRSASDGATKAGAEDIYTMSVNICDSALFRGTINYRPFIKNTISANQTGLMTYSLDADVVNPANPSQTRNVGRVFGPVPVDERNVYRFADGFLKIAVLPMGQAKGFEGRFGGLALGKPPITSGFAKIKQDALRLVSSKGGAVTLKRYDIMSFQSHALAAGPVQIYPEVVVGGDMVYDYDRSIWYFKNLTMTYGLEGKRLFDTLTGTIRWIEAPDRKRSGEGRYEFDVRVNEPPPSESAVFNTSANDESSFFATDDSIPTLSGVMAYKDTMVGDTVTASAVKIDLKGSKLTKQQTMNIAKLLLFSLTIPLNAE